MGSIVVAPARTWAQLDDEARLRLVLDVPADAKPPATIINDDIVKRLVVELAVTRDGCRELRGQVWDWDGWGGLG
jgi:hypothetical protein